jgi:hypothetical protein
VSGEQSSVGFSAVKGWLLGTQAAPACEAGAFVRGRLMTAGRSRHPSPLWELGTENCWMSLGRRRGFAWRF